MEIKYFRQYLANRKVKSDFCESVLGNSAKLHEFSNFWDKNFDEIMVLAAYSINEYITESNPTQDELIAYKK
jgi:hypothetical protein